MKRDTFGFVQREVSIVLLRDRVILPGKGALARSSAPLLKYWSDLVDLNYFEVTLEGNNAEGDHEKLQAEAHARLDAIAGRF